MLRPQKRPTESNILSAAAKVWSRSELNLIIAVINCLDIQTIFKAVFFNLKATVLKGVDDMYTKYLVTGATGFLGRTLVRKLTERGFTVSALVMKSDPLIHSLPDGISVFYGDITDRGFLDEAFQNTGREYCVIHCAGMISIASSPDKSIYRINVQGTENIISLCRLHNVGKLIYVSSVHSIPEKPKGEIITETYDFSPDTVEGDYAKSKAMATNAVLDATGQGINASIVHPSGIIGPGDLSCGNITEMLRAFCAGSFSMSVNGGYDFVDVRDVAAGIIACSQYGKAGSCYILSGHYVTVKELLSTAASLTSRKPPLLCAPLFLARLIAPFYEARSIRKNQKPFFTPYSISVLGSNGLFSHEKATTELGYSPRELSETLRDTIVWMRENLTD